MSGVRPLAGLRVGELDHAPALAVCGKYLAGLGADVVVFPSAAPHSDAAFFDYLNDGKRRLQPPVDSDDLADYDVLLCARPPGDLPDRVIVVVITDFGRVGPKSDWVGGDFLAQAASGLMSLVGSANAAPLAMGGHQIEYTAGVAAFTATMAALHARERDGLGQVVETSLFEAAASIEWKGRILQQVGTELRRGGDLSGPVVTRCSDGFFGLYYRDSDWAAVLRVFDCERLSNDPRFATRASRQQHQTELVEVFSDLSKEITRDELYRRLQAEHVPAGPVMEVADLLKSAQYREREFFAPLRDSNGLQPGLPVTFNGARGVSPQARN
jgi:crotonobetainyl-CoA:carnitine CoA-transferase CaiB-like acyl-CoA transferase